jgi:hypothetical protein
MCAVLLASCGFNTYAKRLEKAGYNVENYSGEKLENQQKAFEKDGYTITGYLVATKADNNSFEVITIIKFDSSSEAKKYVEEDLFATNAIQKGKVVLTGSEDAKNIALGK